MKIHLVIKGLGLGGAERHVVDCAKAFVCRGHDVTVSYLLPHKDALVEELRTKGISVTSLGGRRISMLSSFWRFIRLMYELKPDVVHAHLPVAGILARIAKPCLGFRLVFTEHNVYERLHPVTRSFHRATRFLDDFSISCSRPVAESLPWQSKVIDNGIAVLPQDVVHQNPGLRERFKIPTDAVVYISVANLLKKKNHILLIEAFGAALSGENNAHLVLVGQDGTERSFLESRCSKLGIKQTVHFAGPIPNASALLSDADVFCLSSTFEGLPIALLESMSAGLPAVVTNVGGMPDAVVNGMTGFVVNLHVESFGKALRVMYESQNLRRKMGEEARRRVASVYSMDAMVDKILSTYAH
jgi:glycosyltransferase involved in cell wall biosynthesis